MFEKDYYSISEVASFFDQALDSLVTEIRNNRIQLFVQVSKERQKSFRNEVAQYLSKADESYLKKFGCQAIEVNPMSFNDILLAINVGDDSLVVFCNAAYFGNEAHEVVPSEIEIKLTELCINRDGFSVLKELARQHDGKPTIEQLQAENEALKQQLAEAQEQQAEASQTDLNNLKRTVKAFIDYMAKSNTAYKYGNKPNISKIDLAICGTVHVADSTIKDVLDMCKDFEK